MVEAIKAIFTQAGADVCGAANIEVLKKRPTAFIPQIFCGLPVGNRIYEAAS